MSDTYLRLYAHNQIVPGENRAALYDLQAGRVRFIPPALVPLLAQLADQPVAKIRDTYFAESPEILQRYLDFILREDWGFYTQNPERYPALDLSWESPHRLTTAIVAHDAVDSPFTLADALREIDAIGCQHLELQLFRYRPTAAPWRQLGAWLSECEFRRMTLITDLGDLLDAPLADTLFATLPRLARIYSLGAKNKATADSHRGDLYYTDRQTVGALAASLDREQQYIISSTYFREALVANPYFNRRVAVDAQGGIRNDLLHATTVFGQVGTDSIETVIHREAFRARWRAKPDTIRQVRNAAERYCLPYDRPLAWDEQQQEWYFPPAGA
jgi:hypothetical protein